MSYFDNIYVLTLEKNKEKQDNIKNHLESFGIPFEFWFGFNGNVELSDQQIATHTVSPGARAFSRGEHKPMLKGEYGAVRSHADIAKNARERGLKNYLIFEDDARVSSDFWERIKILETEAPKDADIILLGTIFYGKKLPLKKYQVTDHLWDFKTMNIFGFHAYTVNQKAYDKMIELWEEFNDIADLKIISACKKKVLTGYCMIPHCSYQSSGISDINISKKDRDMIRTKLLYSETPHLNDCPAINESGEVHPKGKWPTSLF